MTVEIITKEELEQFRRELLKDIALLLDSGLHDHSIRQHTASQAKSKKSLLRSKEVRATLGISDGTLKNLRIRGILPYTKMGKTYLYSEEEIMKILNDNKRNDKS